MKTITQEQAFNSGLKTSVTGSILSTWSMTDEKTGEVLRGVKIAWFGGNASITIPSDQGALYSMLKEYEGKDVYVKIDVKMNLRKDGSFKMASPTLRQLGEDTYNEQGVLNTTKKSA